MISIKGLTLSEQEQDGDDKPQNQHRIADLIAPPNSLLEDENMPCNVAKTYFVFLSCASIFPPGSNSDAPVRMPCTKSNIFYQKFLLQQLKTELDFT